MFPPSSLGPVAQDRVLVCLLHFVYRSMTQCCFTDFVNNNPSAFSGAYWDIASLRVYE